MTLGAGESVQCVKRQADGRQQNRRSSQASGDYSGLSYSSEINEAAGASPPPFQWRKATALARFTALRFTLNNRDLPDRIVIRIHDAAMIR